MSQPTPENVEPVVNDDLAAMDVVPTTLGDPTGPSKGRVTVVHLYPREMSIYGDLGNTRCLEARLRWHGYEPNVISHNPGDDFPDDVHLVVGGGGQDSGQVRVEADLEKIGPKLKELAEDGVPMLMICGMYQLFGKAFITVDGKTLPGLGILDVTTRDLPRCSRQALTRPPKRRCTHAPKRSVLCGEMRMATNTAIMTSPTMPPVNAPRRTPLGSASVEESRATPSSGIAMRATTFQTPETMTDVEIAARAKPHERSMR